MGQHRLSITARAPVLAWMLGTLIVPLGSFAAESGYYERKEQGWFWHEPEPAPPAETPVPETVVPPPPPQEPAASPPIMPPAAEPPPLSAAWLREKLPQFRDRALDEPSAENVRAYFYLQRFAMDRAQNFALTAQQVVLGDPYLDENGLRPISTYGAQVFDDVAREKRLEVAKKIASFAGLWYFFRSDCPYCRAQNPILQRLQQRIGLAVLPIAVDGRAMPETAFAHFVPNRGHAEFLNVTQTPTLYLVRKPDQFVLVSEGLLTDDGLLDRMILAAHEAHWIDDDAFNATRPAKRPEPGPLERVLSAEMLNEPAGLIDVLRSAERPTAAASTPITSP